MYVIVDRERRQFLGEFERRDEAEARLAQLLADDPAAEGVLVIESTGGESAGRSRLRRV